MDWWKRLFGRAVPAAAAPPPQPQAPELPTESPEQRLNHITAMGQIAACGASNANLLIQSRRLTGMTGDNILLSSKERKVRPLGGRILEIEWPAQARLHHEDIVALCRTDGGAWSAAALRLGYMFRLGPIAEWIFYEEGDGRIPLGPPEGRWAEIWAAPARELDLGSDCRLGDVSMSKLTEKGASLRRERKLEEAKRHFFRTFLATFSRPEKGSATAVSLANLATVYLDEDRGARALALLLSATHFAGELPEQARDWLESLLRKARQRTDLSLAARMIELGGQVERSSPIEILWRMEDLEIEQYLRSRPRH